MWRGMANFGHLADCYGTIVETIIYTSLQPLYTQVSIAADGLSILAYGQTTLTIDYYYPCTNFILCASCTPIACLSCQSPYVLISGICDNCLIPYCLVCSTTTQCQTCNPLFILSATFSCVCAAGTTLSLNSSTCVSCTPTHCDRCDFSNVCASCTSTFVLSAGACNCPSTKKISSVSTCVNCSIVGCSKCSSDDFCFACIG
jgi:hypothetical protein